MLDQGNTLLEWKFREFEVYERSTTWYFWMTLVVGGLLLSAFFSGNFLFALIIIISAILLFFYHQRGPRMVRCQLTTRGIVIGDTFHPYQQMKDFRIVYEPPDVKNIYLTFPRTLHQRVCVFIDDQNPVEIKKILRRFLPEDTESEGEPLLDTFMRFLKL